VWLEVMLGKIYLSAFEIPNQVRRYSVFLRSDQLTMRMIDLHLRLTLSLGHEFSGEPVVVGHWQKCLMFCWWLVTTGRSLSAVKCDDFKYLLLKSTRMKYV